MNNEHAARLREMAAEQAEQAEYAQSHGNVAEHQRKAAALISGAEALEAVDVAKAALRASVERPRKSPDSLMPMITQTTLIRRSISAMALPGR